MNIYKFSKIFCQFIFSSLLIFSFIGVNQAQTGPGGVGTNTGAAPLQLWQKADAILPVPINGTATPFVDASGHNRNSTSATQATYQSNVANTFPIIRFNGTSMFYDNAYTYDARTVFVVYNVSTTTQSTGATTGFAQIWGDYNPSKAHVALDARSGSSNRGFSFDGAAAGASAKYGINGASLTGFMQNSTTTDPRWTYDQFQIGSVEFQNTQTMTNQRISTILSASATYFFGGDLAEIVVYDRVLNTAERIIVENYLSSKYNITLSAIPVVKDFYAYDAANAQPYFHEVIGVGKSTGASNFHTSSKSSFLEINALSASNDNSYLFMGHNNNAVTYTGAGITVGYERIERTWRADVTGIISDVRFRIHTSELPALIGCQLFLAVDTDGDFTSGTTFVPLIQEGATSIYRADLTSITDGSYITVAQATGSVITLNAVANGTSGEVDLDWNTPVLVGLTGYNIYGGTAPNPMTLLATLPAIDDTYTATGMTDCVLNYFRVVPLVGASETPCEGRDTAIPVNGAVPSALTLNTITPVVPLNGQVTLDFTGIGADVAQIKVYIHPSSMAFDPMTSATSTFTSGITPATTQVTVPVYSPTNSADPEEVCFRITQINDCGLESPYSTQIRCVDLDRQAEKCNDGIDNDGDGQPDCFDTDCAGIDNCPGCIYQVTDPGVFNIQEYLTINVCGTQVGYQTPIFGDIDNDGQTETIVMSTNGCISVIHNRPYDISNPSDINRPAFPASVPNPSFPNTEHEQNLATGQNGISLLTMADVDNNGYIDFFYALAVTNAPIIRYEYMYDAVGPNKFVERWRSNTVAGNTGDNRFSMTSRANTNIADFDEDGTPEVYCGGTIFDAITGQWKGYVGAGNPDGNPRSVPNNATEAGAIFNVSNAADVLYSTDLIDTNADGILDAPCGGDCDGLELLAGNNIYAVNLGANTITTVRTAPVPLAQIPLLPPDAVMSYADLDLAVDGGGNKRMELIVSGYGKVYVWDLVNNTTSNIFDLRNYTNAVTLINPSTGVGVTGVGGSSYYSGVPTINNFDSDPEPEFALTKEYGVVMFDDFNAALLNGGNLIPKWSLTTTDESGTTGLSSYDFLGNGESYLVYRDETTIRVFRGNDGIVYFDSQVELGGFCSSNTGVELPTIGDVNNDGQTEIVASCEGYVIVFQSRSIPWLPSRNVWNQVNYNVTNINDNLTVPSTVSPDNYEATAPPLNDYMAQRPLNTSFIPYIPAADLVLLNAADPNIFDKGNCPSDITFTLRMANQGDADVTVNYPITFYSGDPQGTSWTVLANEVITDQLNVGQELTYTIPFPLLSNPALVYIVLNDEGDTPIGTAVTLPNSLVPECDYTNNFLGPYTINDCFDPLPIQLIYFNGEDETDKVRLDWATASERDNAYFEIQRSFDGKDFVTIDVIQGQKISTQTLEYQTYDYENWTGVAYYRLKQVDTDGTPRLSNTIIFKRSKDLDINIYPNPISSGQDLHIDGLSGQWKAVLYDMAGRKIQNWNINFEGQTYKTPFPNLKKGMYILQLESLDNQEQGQLIEKIIVE